MKTKNHKYYNEHVIPYFLNHILLFPLNCLNINIYLKKILSIYMGNSKLYLYINTMFIQSLLFLINSLRKTFYLYK
jgi:hypothetical protein